MQFLKTLFWALLAIIVAVFAVGNWTTVPVTLWSGLVAEVNLPMLLVITFLAGLFPVLLFHHAVRWRLRQRLATAERTITELRATIAAQSTPITPPAASGTPVGGEDRAMPPTPVITAVPPGVA